MGVEIIAVTAGEAEHPEVTIPHAMRSIVWRLILFYVLAIAIMVTMVPWNQAGGFVHDFGESFCHSIRRGACPVRGCDHEFRCTHGGIIEREY